MNVVIFGKGFGRPRQVNLSGRRAAAYAFVITGFFVAVAFVGGYFYSAFTGSGVSFNEVASINEELAMQRISQAQSEALREVCETAAALAVQATAQLIRENLDEGPADQMIEDSIKEVREKLH